MSADNQLQSEPPIAELKQQFLWRRRHFKLYYDSVWVEIQNGFRVQSAQISILELTDRLGESTIDRTRLAFSFLVGCGIFGFHIITADEFLPWWLLYPAITALYWLWQELQARTVLFCIDGKALILFPDIPNKREVDQFITDVLRQRTKYPTEHYGLFDKSKSVDERLQVLRWLKENRYISHLEYDQLKVQISPPAYASDSTIGFRPSI